MRRRGAPAKPAQPKARQPPAPAAESAPSTQHSLHGGTNGAVAQERASSFGHDALPSPRLQRPLTTRSRVSVRASAQQQHQQQPQRRQQQQQQQQAQGIDATGPVRQPRASTPSPRERARELLDKGRNVPYLLVLEERRRQLAGGRLPAPTHPPPVPRRATAAHAAAAGGGGGVGRGGGQRSRVGGRWEREADVGGEGEDDDEGQGEGEEDGASSPPPAEPSRLVRQRVATSPDAKRRAQFRYIPAVDPDKEALRLKLHKLEHELRAERDKNKRLEAECAELRQKLCDVPLAAAQNEAAAAAQCVESNADTEGRLGELEARLLQMLVLVEGDALGSMGTV